MIDFRKMIPMSCWLLGTAAMLVQAPVAPGQTPVAAPKAAPAPQAAPAPSPAIAPVAPFDVEQWREMAEQAREKAMLYAPDPAQMREITEQARQMAEDAREKAAMYAPDPAQMREITEKARQMAEEARDATNFKFDLKFDGAQLKELTDRAGKLAGDAFAMKPSIAPRAFNFEFGKGLAFAPQDFRGRGSDDGLYNSGQRALDNHKYDEALQAFNQVVSRAGTRADAALYYKAYTLNKMNRANEALAAIAELRKSYASSRWLDDAKALELEINQRAGRPVSPESETDEELKVLAINGIMQSDPDRAIPLLENILKGSNPPKVKDRALFVLAQSSSPRAQQVIEQIAKGGANPDLQLRAINYLSQRRREGRLSNPNLLNDIYNSTNDLNVKRAILNAWRSTQDKERLTTVAKNEKAIELRREAFQTIGNNSPGQPELWPIFQAETSPEMRQEILKTMYNDGNADKLADVAKTDKDPKTRRVAIDVLATQKAANTGDLLVSAYNAETDPQLKQAIINHLSNERTAKYLVQLGRNEKDSNMKLKIVDRLSRMHSKEASDYLAEILSK